MDRCTQPGQASAASSTCTTRSSTTYRSPCARLTLRAQTPSTASRSTLPRVQVSASRSYQMQLSRGWYLRASRMATVVEPTSSRRRTTLATRCTLGAGATAESIATTGPPTSIAVPCSSPLRQRQTSSTKSPRTSMAACGPWLTRVRRTFAISLLPTRSFSLSLSLSLLCSL